jgi:hypothetical protein
MQFAPAGGQSVHPPDISTAAPGSRRRGDRISWPSIVGFCCTCSRLKRKVIAVYRQWRNACSRFELVIDNKGSGMSLIQDLKRERIYAVAVDPEGDKAMRMNAQTARIEAGSVLLPRQGRLAR